MNKKKIIGIVATLIVIGGILVAFFPFVQDFYQQYRQRKLMEEYRSQIAIDVSPGAESADFMKDLTEASSDSEISATEPETGPSPDVTGDMTGDMTGDLTGDVTGQDGTLPSGGSTEATSYVDEQTDLTVIGTIQIPKIEVDMPIFKYSNQYQMDFGAVHVAGTTEIGEIGNCGIAAHRGRAKWYFFNRLDELVSGDSIFVNYNGVEYEYVVYDTLVVLPTQVEVLNRSRTKKILTLITCDPPESDRYRLIIHAILK